jgi:hypothetical protein
MINHGIFWGLKFETRPDTEITVLYWLTGEIPLTYLEAIATQLSVVKKGWEDVSKASGASGWS